MFCKNFTYVESRDYRGLPQEYKGIKFYPLYLYEEEEMAQVMSTFGVPKGIFQTKQILKSSFLKFLIFLLNSDEKAESEQTFKKVLSHITRTDEDKIKIVSYFKAKNVEQTFENLFVDLWIENVRFIEPEFDIIREIVLRQNGTSTKFVEEFNPDLEQALRLACQGQPTLEDRIRILSAIWHKNTSEIYEMTYFQFHNAYEATMLVEDSRIYLPLLLSGQVKIEGTPFKSYKNEISKNKDRYSSIKIAEKTVVNKFASVLGSGQKS